MVAVAQLMPEHHELPGFIARATEFDLNTVHYDEWDPLLTLNIHVPMPWPLFEPAFDEYLHWSHGQPEHDEELLLVFPRCAGPLDSRS